MRFAIATNDSYQSVLESFIESGWEIAKLFISTGESSKVIERALNLGIEVQHSPIRREDLFNLAQKGCDALVVASYKWKIPEWESILKYAINFHPSPLPEGRGPYPLVRAILEGRTSWAITCHKISQEFDQGDILEQEVINVDVDETHETLCLKTQISAAILTKRIAANIDSYWQNSLPQGIGSYWGWWSEQDRTIEFDRCVSDVMRQIRAFGDHECMGTINNTRIFIHRAKAWVESHSIQPGKVVHSNNLSLVVSLKDGYLAITEWSFNSPGAILAHLRN